MSNPLQVLIIEDSEDDAFLLVQALRDGGYSPSFERVDTAGGMRRILKQKPWDVVIADYRLPRFSGLAALEILQEVQFDIPFILVSGTIGEEIAVEAMKAGAHDYLMKENLVRLAPAIRRELREAEIRRERRQAEVALHESQARYRSLTDDTLDTIATGIILLNTHFEVVWINQAIEEYFGLWRDQMMGRDQRELVQKSFRHVVADPDWFARKILAVYRHDAEAESFECHILPHDDRQERWLEYRSQPIESGLYAGGRLEHFYDITQRKQAELALDAHARQQSALFHLSADLVATLDEVELCQKVVHGLRENLGYDHVALFLVDSTTHERVLYACTHPSELLPGLLAGGQGLTERPLQDGRPHYTPDVTQEPAYVPGLAHSRSEIDVPLKIDETVVGVLTVESVQPDAFDQEDFAVLTAVANQASVALARAREHQAVKEAEIRYQSLFDRVPIGLYRTTADGMFVDANPALVEMLRYPDKETLLATPVQNLYVQVSDREEWQKLVDQHGLVRDHEIQICRYDGSAMRARMSVRAVLGDDDTMPLYYEGSMEDVTGRKRTEREIRRLKEFNESIVQHMAEGIIVENVDGYFTFVNPAATALLAYDSPEALLGKHWQDIIAPEHHPLVGAANQRRQQGLSDHYEVQLLRLDGTRLPVWVSGSPRFENNKFTGTLAVFTDISERVEAETERRRLSAAMEQTVDSVIITDTTGKIVYVNSAFERISGFSRNEVIGRNVSILNSGHHDDSFFEEMWATIRAGKVWHSHVVNKKKDGTLYTDEVVIGPIRNERGEVVNHVSVQRDVTRELAVEEQLRRAQRMEAVGQLTAGIAHDFNNLLTAINGFAELLQRQLPPDSLPYDMATKILHSGEHAAGLIDQLLAFSRKQVISPKILNLNHIIVNVDKIVQRVLGEGIELQVSLSPGLWLTEVDPTQIEQVLINLTANARDAMTGGGKLVIETMNVVLDGAYAAEHVSTEPGDYVLLAVSDTGYGMSEEIQAHIFEPFFTTKEVHEGTGLGLASVFGIVVNMTSGRTIGAETEEKYPYLNRDGVGMPAGREASGPLEALLWDGLGQARFVV